MLGPSAMHLLGPETRGLADDDDPWNRPQEAPGPPPEGRPRSALHSKGPASVFNSRLQTQSFLGGFGAAEQLLSDKIKPRRGLDPLVTQVTNTALFGPHGTCLSGAPSQRRKHHLRASRQRPHLYQPWPRWDDPPRSFPRTYLVRSQEGLHPKAHAANECTLSGRARGLSQHHFTGHY